MMKIKGLSGLLIFGILFLGCNKDDDGGGEPLRDYGEVALENDAEIVEFLETHFYYIGEGEEKEILIDTIAGENADKTPLIEQMTVKTIKYNDVDHKLYYLQVRPGAGDKPSSSADAFVRYKGLNLQNERFDVNTTGVTFPLLGGVVRGMREFAIELNASTGFTINPDKTINWNDDYGRGIVVMPSGLAYFNETRGGGQYQSLIFTMDMLTFEETDSDILITSSGNFADPDGILSKDEDVDGDGYPENDDTDEDNIPNYLDIDDDGDGVLTKYEYDKNDDGIADDTDGDGIPDYLDKDN
ncbi:FKBP-type peptidyl-prolyl cis-trans isomerase [Abyssalbus ytuae]|uniref:Uncharacterized protein n=1 Tax=Abyssalbus ytuae TaxID=2926907 RepID=A0A9E6ZP49_9FLAO|nr:hypothetical protein [Abyssalbus ytuae]UOB18289.1 hypothetical protein MQE35_03120 [Abyssalbus ytuae]